jgi:signal transduction histidine kinase
MVALGNLAFFMLAHSMIEDKILIDAKSLDIQTQQFMTEYIKSMMSSFAQTVIVFNVFAILVSFILGVLLLNHIAGPAYAVKRHLDELAEGKQPQAPLKLRKYDFFVEVAESVNRLAAKIISDKKDPKV